ncbi:MAG: glutamate 5-kinase [Candidatus Ranarchaeia archaeon]|jgi:glutamate 5-kinase
MAKKTKLQSPWDRVAESKRIVVKIGTRALISPNGDFDYSVFKRIVSGIKKLMAQKKQVLLVSSGAVSAGMTRLSKNQRPLDLVQQQVMAAVGNPYLFGEYAKFFGKMPIAQILLTQENLSHRKSYLHVKNTLETALRMKIVPIINENDVVSIDELAGFKTGEDTTYNFSDNDVLSALITASIGADLLVILSDVDGFYDADPLKKGASKFECITEITPAMRRMAKRGSSSGRGGMVTKLRAAEIATRSGANFILANAKTHSLYDIVNKGKIGTIFCSTKPIPRRELWMVYAANIGGSCYVDDGAKKAVIKGASLLLPGIFKVKGDFTKGEVIELRDAEGNVFAKGLTNFSAQDIKRFLKFMKTDDFLVVRKLLSEVVSHTNICLVD